MKIENLTFNSSVYTCNAYLVTGDFNSMDDVNTLIDTGRDAKIIDRIWKASTGVGKKRVEQVIFTHNHYDHAGLIKEIKESFNSKFYAFSNSLEGIDVVLKGGERLKIGDRFFDIIYTPGHSSDSICLYNREENVLFSGDTNLIIYSNDGTYEKKFVEILGKLADMNIKKIYPGHGNPIIKDCNEIINMSFKNVLQSKTL